MKPLLLMLMMVVCSTITAQRYRVSAVKKGGKDTSLSNTAKVAPRIKPVADSTLVWIPSVFTPNYDGLNDLFKPIVMNADSFWFEIYSREGQLLQTLYAGDTWKGTGTLSVYVWVAKWKDKNGKYHREGGLLKELR